MRGFYSRDDRVYRCVQRPAPQLEEAGRRGPEGPGAHLPKPLRGYLNFGMQKGL